VSRFEDAATDAVPALGTSALRVLAQRIEQGWPKEAILGGMGPAFAEATRPVLDALCLDEADPQQAAGFLRGLAAGYARHAAAVSVETVWSGPSSHAVPVRETAQALTQVVACATDELLLMTYSAKRHQSLREALTAAIERGVRVTVIVETLQGAGSALGSAEPAAAFTGIDGLDLWHWPVDQRDGKSAKMHAKIAVADRRTLLVTSANLTQSGAHHNIESGLLIRGGGAPARAAEHVLELRSRRVLGRLSHSGATA
jgi:phosphatidylserine/phosphatidylglycerophosphate/cardiolipin synthase-like enzyme